MPSLLVNAIEVGYNEYFAEDELNSLDAFATKQNYVTPVYKVDDAAGNKLDIVADCSADHYQIEYARRNPLTGNGTTNRKYDETLFLLNVIDEVNETTYSTYDVRQDQDFTSITGIYSPETAYNLTISPHRNLLRWQKFIDPSFYRKTGQSIKYLNGVANQALETQLDGEGAAVAESDSIAITAQTIYLPVYINFSAPLTFDQYKLLEADAGRKKYISVSRTDTGHISGYLQSVKYRLQEGKADFKLIQKA